jgi:hypothetical protein
MLEVLSVHHSAGNLVMIAANVSRGENLHEALDLIGYPIDFQPLSVAAEVGLLYLSLIMYTPP